jgi:hypothetical protein
MACVTTLHNVDTIWLPTVRDVSIWLNAVAASEDVNPQQFIGTLSTLYAYHLICCNSRSAMVQHVSRDQGSGHACSQGFT